jgi:GNAT superfamily N-acetyltransferase
MLADYDRAVREHRIDLAVGAEGLVGLIETENRPDHLWVENVAVRPDYQGRGVGRLLLRHAEMVARAEGLRALRLLTNRAFETNVVLYRRLGYVIDRTEPFLDGFTVYMSKALGSEAAEGDPPCDG